MTITGITGYVGSLVARLFLEDGGYKVRGTVRDLHQRTLEDDKLEPLRECLGTKFNSIELVEADMLNDQQI